MINVDDVERLLGKRPFTNVEMRNIDRVRASDKEVAAAAAGSDDGLGGAESAPEAADRDGGGGGGGGSSGGRGRGGPKGNNPAVLPDTGEALRRRVEPGVVLAT